MKVPRLTPDEFKDVFKRRGWNGKTLAARWEVSEAWISKIVTNTDRAPHWDDAVNGLPVIEVAKKKRTKQENQ